MSCYHPLRGIFKGYDENGKKILKIVPFDAWTSEAFNHYQKYYEIPCGHCIGCRQDQSKEWSNRLILESLYHDSAYFTTLTYSDKYLPVVIGSDLRTGEISTFSTLDVSACQRFLKRLRYYLPTCDIRYYLAGEYGDRTDRAHYHAILFGLDLPRDSLVPCGRSETGNQYYTCDLIQKCWSDPESGEPYGFVSIEPANFFTMKYTAMYVSKKLGMHPNLEYEVNGRQPPFSISSKRPAIGLRYFEDHPECVLKDRIVLGLPDGPVNISIPKYFKKKFRELHPEEYEKIAEKHLKAANDRIEAELSKTDLCYIDYLKVKEENHYARLKQRNKI